jgi:hypothetical protein
MITSETRPPGKAGSDRRLPCGAYNSMGNRRLRRTARSIAWTASLLLAAGACPAWAEGRPQWQVNASAGIGYDSNPANAEAGSTLPATGYAASSLAAGLTLRPVPRLALVLRGGLDGQQYFDYSGLSNTRESAETHLFYRPADDFNAPTLSAWGEASAWQFGSHMRSGAQCRGGLSASEQLNTAFHLRAGVYASGRGAASPVFDLHQQAARLSLDWLVGGAATLYAGYEFRYGDFAESSPRDPGTAAFALAKAPDDSLVRDGVREIAYRIRGHAQIGSLGLNLPLNSWLAIDAQGQQIHTRAASGDHYNRWLAEFDLLARF